MKDKLIVSQLANLLLVKQVKRSLRHERTVDGQVRAGLLIESSTRVAEFKLSVPLCSLASFQLFYFVHAGYADRFVLAMF